ncbi:hypothetical protein MtrunA17_Chr6g0487671 [Medicago truncatula]|uniref:Uncharacterized protein n=1 Tax=Medicago truncatula TaxID=3880 RepID=A0A396HID0_MEDTR|nr:hypothetical protein MtrunA17_Chr6g0487671 [Medicago truncatula]
MNKYQYTIIHTQSSITYINKTHVMICTYRHIHACGTKSPQGRHLRCNKNIVCKISHPSYIISEVKEFNPFTTTISTRL